MRGGGGTQCPSASRQNVCLIFVYITLPPSARRHNTSLHYFQTTGERYLNISRVNFNLWLSGKAVQVRIFDKMRQVQRWEHFYLSVPVVDLKIFYCTIFPVTSVIVVYYLLT